MNKANVKIAQELFKNAVQLIKQECYTNPENISDERAMANLIGKGICHNINDAYYVISQLLQECNDKEVADEFNRIHQVSITNWEV